MLRADLNSCFDKNDIQNRLDHHLQSNSQGFTHSFILNAPFKIVETFPDMFHSLNSIGQVIHDHPSTKSEQEFVSQIGIYTKLSCSKSIGDFIESCANVLQSHSVSYLSQLENELDKQEIQEWIEDLKEIVSEYV